MYHDVSPHVPGMDAQKLSLLVTPERFAQQMQYLHDHGFTTITLDDWMSARAGWTELPTHPVILTFDDGRLGVYRNAFPVLRRNGQKAILFLISGEVGRIVKGYLDWAMVREMQSTGLVTFGSHTVHHVELSLASPQRALMELSYSKMVIQRNTGRRCDYFCYPYGKYSAWVAKLVGAAGYRAATTEIPGWSRITDNAYELRRVRVDGRDTMAVFAAKLSGGPLTLKLQHNVSAVTSGSRLLGVDRHHDPQQKPKCCRDEGYHSDDASTGTEDRSPGVTPAFSGRCAMGGDDRRESAHQQEEHEAGWHGDQQAPGASTE
jgi:peptidoglycan/xylan/chitin deacetylase (PgdA/CDA1 family)